MSRCQQHYDGHELMFLHLKFRMINGKFKKSDKITEQVLDLKERWRKWCLGYHTETMEVLKQNKGLPVIVCPECSCNVKPKSFLNHQTKLGCPNMRPEVKFYNWK